MTNQLAVFLGICIIAFLVGDAIYYGSDNTLFLMRKFEALIEWMAFWR